ncbi:hypothetical protein RB653_005098 [Dictyostelium firmibasis]|uniref:Uncharacterized protein n=1 Tax=Dictyostelium firmibasis TaxID=79012 RepID=A0AAN7U4R0_9MYCE
MIPSKNKPTQQSQNNNKQKQQQQQQQQYKKIIKRTITLNKFLIITSIILILCLFLFNTQITRILSSSTPVFYSKFYYPIQSQFSKLKTETTVKIENETQQLREKGKEKKEQLKDKSEKIIDEIKDKKNQYKDKFEENLNQEKQHSHKQFNEKTDQLKHDTKSKFDQAKEKSKDLKEKIKSKSYDLKENVEDFITGDGSDDNTNIKGKTKETIEHGKDIFSDNVNQLKMKLVDSFDFSNFAKLKDMGIAILNKLSGSEDDVNGKWAHFQFGSFVAEQGALSKEDGYLRLESNPFTSTTALSVLDHIKYLAVSNQVYTIPEGGSLFSNFSVRGKAFGNKNHPFPSDLVKDDIESEIRFATGSLNVLDFKTSIVADFMISNSKLYALYERLPFSRGQLGDYAAFVYTIPIADITDQSKFMDVSVEFNYQKKSIHWYLNDREVFKVEHVGYFSHLIENQQLNERGGSLIMSKGGVESYTFPTDIQVCFGVFSLLDTTIHGKNIALVRLDDPTNKYYDPTNLSKELKFYDEKSTLENRIFGQGFTLDIQKISVSSK